jgi:hypothetical protein
VVQIGAQPITSVATLESALSQRIKVWLVTVKRGERKLTFEVQV